MKRFGPAQPPAALPALTAADRRAAAGRRAPRAALLDRARRASSARDLLDVGALTRPLFSKRLPQAEKFRPYYGRVDMNLIQEVLRAADVGVMTPRADLERESMSLCPHSLALAQKRFGALSTLDFRVDAASGPDLDPKIAEEIAATVRSMLGKIRGVRQAVYDIAWSLFDGRGALEIDWVKVGGRTPFRPHALDWIHPRRIGYGPERELRIVNTFTSGRGWWQENGVALGDYPGKFATWQPRYFCDYPEREGLGRRGLYWQLFKRFSARMRMILTELFAIPYRTIEFDAETEFHQVSWEDLDAAEDAAEALGGENTVALSPGARLDIKWPGENSGQLFEMTRLGVNEELSKLWVLNTATTDAKSDSLGGGTANVHKGEQGIALARDAYGIGEVFQTDVVDVFVVLNYGPSWLEYSPTVALESADEIDRAKEQAILESAIARNIPVGLGTYYEKTGIPQPGDDEPVIVSTSDGMGGSAPRIVYPPGWEGARFGEATAAPEPPDPDGESGAPPAGGGAGPAPAPAPAAPPSGPAGAIERLIGDGKAPPSAAPATDDGGAPTNGAGDGSPGQEARLRPEPAADEAEAAKRIAAARAAQRLTLAHIRASVNGSEEELVGRGVKRAIRHTAVWAQTLVDAIDDEGGHVDAHKSLSAAAKKLDLEGFAREIERTTVLSLCLGALDSAWEAAHAEHAHEAGSFAAERASGLILGSPFLAFEVPGFVRMPFSEAISAFLGKQIVTRRVFDRLAAEAKRRAFTIAGLAQKSLLTVAHDELTKGIADGIDLRTFRANLAQRFESNGWTPLNKAHVETIFRTNISGAYASGRDVQQRDPAVLAARPYWQIQGVNDDRAREAHKAVHGHVLHFSDPFWARAPLPWGFNERCYRTTRSAADLARLGLQVTAGSAISGLPDKGFTGGGGGLFDRGRERAHFFELCVYGPELFEGLYETEAPAPQLEEDPAPPAPPVVVAAPGAGATRVYAGSIVVLIDRPAGTVETGTGADGQTWTRTWPFDGGELPRTQAGDGEPIDVFCGPGLDEPVAYWLVQKGADPELRLALGWADEAAARAAYASICPPEMLDRCYPQPVEHLKAILGIAPVAALLEAVRALDRA